MTTTDPTVPTASLSKGGARRFEIGDVVRYWTVYRMGVPQMCRIEDQAQADIFTESRTVLRAELTEVPA